MNVWITGASSGIGLALAQHYAAAGHTVLASARASSKLSALSGHVLPGTIHCYPLDVTDEAAVLALVTAMEAAHGPLDLAILNAGTYASLGVKDFNCAAARALMEVNYFGVCHGLAALMPRFIARQRGTIAAMASLAGYCGLPYAGTYSAAKSAVIRLCESLAPELAQQRVRLCVINPGFVKTPLTDLNEFPMPLLMPAHTAAQRIAQGLAAGPFEIRAPRRLAWLMRVLASLPYGLYFRLTRRLLRAP